MSGNLDLAKKQTKGLDLAKAKSWVKENMPFTTGLAKGVVGGFGDNPMDDPARSIGAVASALPIVPFGKAKAAARVAKDISKWTSDDALRWALKGKEPMERKRYYPGIKEMASKMAKEMAEKRRLMSGE